MMFLEKERIVALRPLTAIQQSTIRSEQDWVGTWDVLQIRRFSNSIYLNLKVDITGNIEVDLMSSVGGLEVRMVYIYLQIEAEDMLILFIIYLFWISFIIL